MPLLDHFRPPLSERRPWHSFHHAWATVLAFDLNRVLPPGWFADPNVRFGIEIDVGTFEDGASGPAGASWQPPAPTQTVVFSLATDVIEVRILDGTAGPALAGAIELVSPANKHRPAHRDAFVSKCADYLQQGIGLIVVDVVTTRSANLHAELLRRLNQDAAPASASDVWAAAYRPRAVDPEDQLDVWHEALALGRPIEALPLALKNGPCLRVDLEAAYHRTCEQQRMIGNGKP